MRFKKKIFTLTTAILAIPGLGIFLAYQLSAFFFEKKLYPQKAKTNAKDFKQRLAEIKREIFENTEFDVYDHRRLARLFLDNKKFLKAQETYFKIIKGRYKKQKADEYGFNFWDYEETLEDVEMLRKCQKLTGKKSDLELLQRIRTALIQDYETKLADKERSYFSNWDEYGVVLYHDKQFAKARKALAQAAKEYRREITEDNKEIESPEFPQRRFGSFSSPFYKHILEEIQSIKNLLSKPEDEPLKLKFAKIEKDYLSSLFKQYDIILKKRPAAYFTWEDLGDLQFYLGDVESSAKSYRKAVMTCNDDYVNRGKCSFGARPNFVHIQYLIYKLKECNDTKGEREAKRKAHKSYLKYRWEKFADKVSDYYEKNHEILTTLAKRIF